MSTGAKIGIGVGSAVLVLALVVGVIVLLPLGDDESGSAAPETSATEETEEDTTEEDGNDDTVPDPDAEVFTGSEDERIELDEPHSDPRIVALEAEDFASVNLLGPDNGVYTSLGSNHGETNRVMYNYFEFMGEDEIVAIEVTGMGDWTVTLEPLSTAVPWTDPEEPLEGEGSEVYSIDWDASGEDVAMEHNGDSNFAIWAINLNEGNFELLVNEIGTYEGSETLPSGSAFLDVSADGRWSLTVS